MGMEPEPHTEEPPAWCVVANVAVETAHGDAGLELRRGLKHFSPGAKVWVLPPQWGDGGERLIVIGRHRGNHVKYMSLVVERRHLENFRVHGVYSPAVLRRLDQRSTWEDRESAINAPSLRAAAPSTPSTRRPSRYATPSNILPANQ
jgi:hypothetical protein